MRKEADDAGPFAELEHWRHLVSRFNSLIQQIRSHDIKVVIQILHVAKSKVLKVSSVNVKQLLPSMGFEAAIIC